MSADNWTECPKCMAEWNQKYDSAIKEVESQYGKIPMDEFLKLKVRKIPKVDIGTHFREDYEIFMKPDGTLYISYSGYCTECEFSHNFHKEEKVTV